MPLRATTMNSYLKRIISIISCAVLSAIFIIIMRFCAPAVAFAPEALGTLSNDENTAVMGRDVTAVRITDLADLQQITKVNYIPDEFVFPDSLLQNYQIVDLTKSFDFAEKGTLVFIILNLKPDSEDYREQVEALNKYKAGDYWHFTFELPKIYCASNVYLKSKLVARNGEIENYDFINFNTSYDKRTENFKAQTAGVDLDLQFYTRRQAMDDEFAAAQVITIHYQSKGTAFSGVKNAPLIGEQSAVTGVISASQNLLIAAAILTAVVFAVFSVLSVLKRTAKFIPSIIWIFGITVMLLTRFLANGVTAFPLLWAACSLAAPFFILGGALLSAGVNVDKFPLKYLCPAVMAIGALLAFICPYIPFAAAESMRVVCTVLRAAGTVALLTFIGIETFRKNRKSDVLHTVCAAVIAVAFCASLFLPQIFPAQYNPMFWLCAITALVTFISVFILFNQTEKANAYLTANLHKEVERQVNDIKAVITERDNLLRFVSHDMKKPLVSSASLLETLIEREKDAEQVKALNIIKQNTGRVVTNLSEIGNFARFNYIAEPSQVVDLRELCASLYEFHTPDCIANGIVLKNFADKNFKVFAKKQGLENAVSNIILNAVEHSDCNCISVYARAEKNRIVLSIADNGKGISSGLDVFAPYVSENNAETNGVGLYICKNIIESMNGELTYSSERGGAVFHISLLKA